MHVSNAAAATPEKTLQASHRVFVMPFLILAQKEQSLASRAAPQKF